VEPILFVMAILGCGESDAACRELRVEQVRYRSEAACMAATEAALMRNDDLAFPSIVASCRPAGARAQPLRGSDVLRPPPEMNRRAPRLASARAARSSR
jgi:hypothetical protein